MLNPPIRIVSSEELKAQISARLKNPNPVGRKSNKMKQTQSKQPFRLQADQIHVPHAVFCQEDGIELSQITHSDLGAQSRGVVVVSIEEALPYFRLPTAVSSEGVALLITDAFDERIPSSRQIIRVPAHCRATKEPMLFTAAILQLGGKQVRRNVPQQCLEIQQVPNVVIRVVTFRDQLPEDWNVFNKRPAKNLLEAPPFVAHPASEILDVWDRQYLTSRSTFE